jgi:hypothetical protein
MRLVVSVLVVLGVACSGRSTTPTQHAPPPPPPHDGTVAKTDATVPPHCTPGMVGDCKELGFSEGQTTCTPEGDFSLTDCRVIDPHVASGRKSATCGNGRIDTATEHVCAPCVVGNTSCPCSNVQRSLDVCDGADLGGQSCERLGYLGGSLRCTDGCAMDTSGCSSLAAGHRWRTMPAVPGLAGIYGSTNVPAAIAAVPGALGVAWGMRRGKQDPNGNPISDIVFAWSDPSLALMRTSVPFEAGYAGPMELGGNASGWLLAVSTYGDNPGPNVPGVTVFPISTHGHVGKPGKRVPHQEALFLVRGNGDEPSLVGALVGKMSPNGEAMWHLEGWLVDAHGEPLGAPFPIGTPVQTYSVMGARAAYIGGGKFVVARGSTRDPAIEISIVDTRGKVTVLPVAHKDLVGMPVGLVVSPSQIDIAFVKSMVPATHLASFTSDGKLVDAPHAVAQGAAAGMLPDRTVVTVDAHLATLQKPGGSPTPLLSGAALNIPFVVSADDASYLLAITQTDARIVRLR